MIAKTWMAVLCCALTLPVLAQEGGAPEEQPEQPPSETPTEVKSAEPEEPPKKKSSLEDPPLHRWGGWTVSLAAWGPASYGAEDQVAVLFPPSGNLPRPLDVPTSSDLRESLVVAYHLPGGRGSIVGRYDSMNDSDAVFYATPGQFVYAQTLTAPEFRGAFDDGMADAVAADSSNRTRDVRLEYAGTAWESRHTRGTWSAGLRNVDHNEKLEAVYYGLAPNLPFVMPPIIDPTPDPSQWQPLPDRALLQSDYTGTGLGAALDVEFVFHPRFSIISGLSIGLLRGKVSTISKSFTSFYVSSIDGHYVSPEELISTLQTGPFNCTDENPTCISAISQSTVFNGLYVPSASQTGQTWDGYIGIQSQVWRGLRVFGSFREMYYQNVGADAVLLPDNTVETRQKSVGYEGYMLGVSWRF